MRGIRVYVEAAVPRFRPGDRVVHASLGPGVVREMRSPEMVLVRFRSEYGRPYSAMVHVDALRFVARAVRDKRIHRQRRAYRDPSKADLGTILEYAERVRQGDEASRDVLHDALLERYPKIYGSVIRLAESPSGHARTIVGGRKESVLLGHYSGPRAILLWPEHLARGEAQLRNPRWSGQRQTREKYVRDWIRYAFDVLPLSVAKIRTSRPSDREVITYVSRFEKTSASLPASRDARWKTKNGKM